jgi:alginate O-acetyltransferase complex protein AlgI
MADLHLWHFLALSLLTLFVWILPSRWQFDAVAVGTLLFIMLFSPWTAFLLVLNCLLVYQIALHKQHKSRWIVAAVLAVMLQFVCLRLLQQTESQFTVTVSLLGLAYSSCRHIHYLVENYRGKITPDLRSLLHYQLFLPVLVTGPINRYPEFIRSLQRRRWDHADFSKALERIIYGYAKVVIIGNYIIDLKIRGSVQAMELSPALQSWVLSALDWAYLYAQFSGWSDVAIGFSLLMGVQIAENFNNPLKATNLIEFWQRWHISLSSWCKDYIFVPVVSITRKPLLAVTAAMLVMGAWHELSLYYVLWGCYHAIGIAGCRLFQAHFRTLDEVTQHHSSPNSSSKVTMLTAQLGGWCCTFFFIVSGAPVITFVQQWIQSYV